MRNAYELVLIRALRHAVSPLGAACAEPEDLVRIAGGNRWVLERALLRVEHALLERSSAVGERAREILTEALQACPLTPARAS